MSHHRDKEGCGREYSSGSITIAEELAAPGFERAVSYGIQFESQTKLGIAFEVAST